MRLLFSLVLLATLAASLEQPRRQRLPVSTNKMQGGKTGGGMSENAAIVSLVKTIIGAGIMALPSGMAAGRGTGVVPALFIVALHASLSAYTYTLVGRAVEASGATDFNSLWRSAFSSKSSWVIDVMVGGVSSGVILTFGCFLGELMSSLLPISRNAAVVAVALFPLAPLALARDLSALKHTSMLGVFAVLSSAFVIVKRSLDGTYPGEFRQLSLSKMSVGTCVLFNMLSTAFMAHTNAVRAYRELDDKSRQYAVAVKAWLVSAVLYGSVMLAGYSTFGDRAKGLVLANYADDDPLALATRVATAISLFGSHPLVFTSLRDVSFSLTGLSPENSFKSLSLGLLAFFTCLALLVPDAGFVVSITGASVGAALILVVPSLMCLRVAPVQKYERLFLKSLVGFGLAIAAFGTVVTCLETFTDFLN